MDLLYITDISQLHYVRKREPKFLDRCCVVTNDIVVLDELHRLKLNYINEWDYLDASDIERNQNSAYLLIENWYDEQLIKLEFEGINLPDAAKLDLVHAIEPCLNARSVYERILKEKNVKHIFGFFLSPEFFVVTL